MDTGLKQRRRDPWKPVQWCSQLVVPLCPCGSTKFVETKNDGGTGNFPRSLVTNPRWLSRTHYMPALPGSSQSPINIVDEVGASSSSYDAVYDDKLKDLAVAYSNQAYYTVAIDDHELRVQFVKADVAADGLTIPGQGFLPVVQMAFRTPSEHTLNGESFPLEAQFLHSSVDGRKSAVISVFYKIHADPYFVDPLLQAILGEAPNPKPSTSEASVGSETDTVKGNGAVLNLDEGVFGQLDLANFYSYTGSLAVPPCMQAREGYFSDEELANDRGLPHPGRSMVRASGFP